MKLKLASIGLLFLALLVFLLFQALGAGVSSVMLPSELHQLESDMKRIRIAGRVHDDDINYQVDPNFELKFNISDPGQETSLTVPVVYEGIKPDMFAVGRDVIIDGEYLNGEVRAYTLLTQCPSKYEPPKPGDY